MSRRDAEWYLHVGTEISYVAAEFGNSSPKVARQKGWVPRVDVFELRDVVVVRVELAGIRPDEVQLRYVEERHALSLRGERRDEPLLGEPGVRPQLLEIEYGEFAREIALPPGEVDAQAARTQLSNGLLTVVLPRRSDKETRKAVESSVSTDHQR